MRISRTLVGLGVAGTLFLAGASSAFAGQSTPGTPGTKNCKGLTTAYVAQGNPTGFLTANGIGNVAKVNLTTVQGVQSAIQAYCDQ